jgi:hypothetical protein
MIVTGVVMLFPSDGFRIRDERLVPRTTMMVECCSSFVNPPLARLGRRPGARTERATLVKINLAAGYGDDPLAAMGVAQVPELPTVGVTTGVLPLLAYGKPAVRNRRLASRIRVLRLIATPLRRGHQPA